MKKERDRGRYYSLVNLFHTDQPKIKTGKRKREKKRERERKRERVMKDSTRKEERDRGKYYSLVNLALGPIDQPK